MTAEKKTWIGIACTLACVAGLLAIAPPATIVISVLLGGAGLLAGLVELLRKRPSKPWFVLGVGSIVLILAGAAVSGAGMKEERAQQQQRREEASQASYDEACALLAGEKFQEAIDKFSALRGYKDSEIKLAQARQSLLNRIYADLMASLDKAESGVAESPKAALEEAERILKRYYELLQSKGDYGQLETRARAIAEKAKIQVMERSAAALRDAAGQIASGETEQAARSLEQAEALGLDQAQKDQMAGLRQSLSAKQEEQKRLKEVARRAQEVEEVLQRSLSEVEEARKKAAAGSLDEALPQTRSAITAMEGIEKESPKAAEALVAARALAAEFSAAKEKGDEEARTKKHGEAAALLKQGKLLEARTLFQALGDYGDSRKFVARIDEKLAAQKYKDAVSSFKKKQYAEARALFVELGSYKDASDYVVRIDEKLEAIQQEQRLADLEARASGLSYKQLKKNPDRWIGTFVKFRGQVFNIQETDGKTVIQVNVTNKGYGFWDDQIVVVFDGYTSVVDENVITFFGTVTGTLNYTSAAGWDISVPAVKAEVIYH
jgi:hypothetical protein